MRAVTPAGDTVTFGVFGPGEVVGELRRRHVQPGPPSRPRRTFPDLAAAARSARPGEAPAGCVPRRGQSGSRARTAGRWRPVRLRRRGGRRGGGCRPRRPPGARTRRRPCSPTAARDRERPAARTRGPGPRARRPARGRRPSGSGGPARAPAAPRRRAAGRDRTWPPHGPNAPVHAAFAATTSIRAWSSAAGSDGQLSSSGRSDREHGASGSASAGQDSARRCSRPVSSIPNTRPTASSTWPEAVTRSCSSHVYQVTPTPASVATSSRRSPGARRRPVTGSPTCPGPSRSR